MAAAAALVLVACAAACADEPAGRTGGGGGFGGGSGSGGGTGGGDGPTCVGAGYECTDLPCCDGSICVVGGAIGPTPLCAAECEFHEHCLSNCCAELSDGTTMACHPPSVCAPATDCGVILVGDDGEFLGDATSNELALDGVCNEFSNFGSPYSATSIYNEFSEYGSEFGPLSAYNEFTSTPPFLYDECLATVIAVVTVNTLIVTTVERVDPNVLCAWLEAEGL